MQRLLLFVLFAPSLVTAQPSALDSKVKEVTTKVVEWRRHFHQYPELSNREFNTSAKVAEHLKGLGLEVKTGVAKTGGIAM